MASAEEQRKLEERARVMMADLSRLRQEELPLSSRETRGPSFNPTRKNGVDHIPAAQKEKWKAQWNVEFDDEEARQCEGLELEDSRPYAKNVAPPLPHHSSKGLQVPRIWLRLSSDHTPSAEPGSASIALQFPDSFNKKKKKKKSKEHEPPVPRSLRSGPSENGSTISASQPSWTARRMYAISTRNNASPLRQPSSRVSGSVIASANDFLKSAAHEQIKKQGLQSVQAPAEIIQPEGDNIFRSRSPLDASTPPPPQPQNGLPVKESDVPDIQLPSVALIDLDEESGSDSRDGEKEELEHDVDEILRLLDLAKERIPVLVKSLDGGTPCEVSTLVALSTILGGLLQLRRSFQRTEERGQAQQASVAMTSSYNELMELVESVHPPRLCYSPEELLRLRGQAVLPSADTEALEQTKMAHGAFAAVREARSMDGMPMQLAEMSIQLAQMQRQAQTQETSSRDAVIAHSAQPSQSSVDVLTTRTASWTLNDTPLHHETIPTYDSAYAPTQGHPLFVLPPRLSCAVPIKADNSEEHQKIEPNEEVRNWPVKQVLETLAKLDREDEEASGGELVPTATPQSGTKGKKGLASSMWA